VTRFSNGIGRLRAQDLNGIMGAAEQVNRAGGGVDPYESRAFGPVPCKILSSAEMDDPHTGRWFYTVREVSFTSDRVGTEQENGLNMSTVVNLAEMPNTTTVHSGITIADLPGNFALQAITAGTIVLVWTTGNGQTTGNKITGYFNQPGEFDGNCS
jgi:hypothetical protein